MSAKSLFINTVAILSIVCFAMPNFSARAFGQTESEAVKSACENCEDGKCDACAEKCESGECEEGECNSDAAEVATVAKVKSSEKKKSDKEKTDKTFTNTHKQTEIFTPKIDGETALLSTFRVREDGKIVACVAPTAARGKKAKKKSDDDSDEDFIPKGYIHVYSSDFKLENEIPLPFSPSAIDLDKSGNYFVAGGGQISKVTTDGQIELTSESPTMKGVDMEELKEEIREEMEEQLAETKEMLGDQLKKFEKQIAKVEEKDEDDRSAADKAKLKMLKTQVKQYEEIIESQSESTDQMLEYRMQASSRITAVAVTNKDVFLATSSKSGSGYEVHRMPHKLDDAKKVLKKLRGCCGQMDIHAKGDHIFVAENTKFQVGIYDRDGEKVSSFGDRIQGKNQGFGSCCNPMNVLCCDNGDILTAESSIGKIKRFNEDGEMIGYIGRARIGGGCKHVAFGHDEKLDRFYVQYEDNNQICVLDPVDSIKEKEDSPELAILKQRLSQGKWQLSSVAGDEDKAEQSVIGVGIAIKQEEDGNIVVMSMIPGSPADENERVNKGDSIISAGDVGESMTDLNELSLKEVVDLIRGPENKVLRVRVKSADTGKIRRARLRRVKMELVDGEWVTKTKDPNDLAGGDWDHLTKVKTFDFSDDGGLKFEMEVESPYGDQGSSPMKWLVTKFEDDTLFIDVETKSDDMIAYRLKIKFDDEKNAQISTTYDGLGEEGEYRSYRMVGSDSSDDDEESEDEDVDASELSEDHN